MTADSIKVSLLPTNNQPQNSPAPADADMLFYFCLYVSLYLCVNCSSVKCVTVCELSVFLDYIYSL